MKIAHVVDSMEMGGAETLVAQMCRVQRERGHEPIVYAIGMLGPLGERMRAEGFAVHANIGNHLVDSTRRFFHLFGELRPDVVHAHNPTPTIYAAMAARLCGASCVISTRHSLVAPPHNLVMEMKYAVAARFCDSTVGICDATTDNLRRLHTIPARKIVRIYNGAAPLVHIARQDQPSKSGFTLVYVGRLEAVKNHALLLNAFRQALVSNPGLRLWMVGNGSQRSTLETMAAELGVADCVRFWGQQLEVAPFFSAADAFIMSSKSEGLPMSLLQAFSLGVPVIVTDVGGMAEAVRLAEAGFTVSATDPAEMSSAILKLAEGDPQRRQFSANAKRAFHSFFSLESMVDAYLALYRSSQRASRSRS